MEPETFRVVLPSLPRTRMCPQRKELTMPYKNKPRPYKKEYKQQKARGEHEARMERQRARRSLDKKKVNRKGKDIAHKKALSRGGSNKDGYTLQSPKKNRAAGGRMSKPRKKK